MKIQFCSDLHLEMRGHDYRLSKTDADIIVLAGDIHVGTGAIEFASEESDRQNKPVVIVAGNHEFYGHDYYHMLNKIRAAANECENVYLLENSQVIIDGVRFLGGTLWTDYLGNNTKHKGINMAHCERMLRDHVVIRNGIYNFTPTDAAEVCRVSKLFLTHKLNIKFNGPTVVVTHHGPSTLCQHKSYQVNAISTAFMSDMNDLVRKADLWIYGHTHSNLDAKVGDCRLVSNQQGYPGEGMPVPFKPNWVVEV